jgi:hypothetical protein
MSKAAIQAGGAFVRLFLKDDLTKAIQTTMQNAGDSIQSAGRNLAKAGAMFGVAGGGILAPIVMGIKKFADMGDQLDKMSQRTGVAAEELAAYRFAAEQSGSSLEEFERSIRRTQQSIGDLARGVPMMTANFERLGISLADLQGLSPDKQFDLIADRIVDIEDPTRRAAAAIQIFGRGGTAMLPMLENLRALKQEAHDLGIVPSDEEVKKAAEVTDAINRVRRTVESAFFNIGAAMADDILAALDRVKTITVAVSNWIKENQKLVVTVAAVGAGLIAFGGAVTMAGFALMGIGAALKAIGVTIALVTSPMGLLTVALVGGAVAFFRFTDAGKKAWTDLIATVMPLAETFKTTFGGISDALKAGEIELAGEILMTGLELVVRQGLDILKGLFGGTVTTIANQLLKGDLSGAWATVVDSMLVTWQGFKTATIEVFAGIVVSVKKMWADMMTALVGRITEVAMEDTWRGAMWRKVIDYDPREDAKFGHAGMQAQLDREKKTLEQMEADMRDRGYVGTFAEHAAREELGMPVMEAQLDQQRKIIAEQEALLREAGYVTKEEIFDPVAEAKRITQERLGDTTTGFSGTMLRAAEEARQAERDLVQAQREAQENQSEEASARVKQLEKRLAALRQRAADAAAAPKDQAKRDEQDGGLVTAARPTGIANIGGMFRAAAISAAGRGVSPEEKSLEELRQIRKEAREQRLATNRLALATERRNLAMIHG